MNRPIRLLAAGIILIALAGADGPSSCKRQDGVETNRPDRQPPNPLRQRIVFITAHGDMRYEVIVYAAKVGETTGDRTQRMRDGGQYRQTLSYESGLRIEITVTVKGSPDDWLSCAIKDGGREAAEDGPGLVQCNLTTSR